MAVADSAPRPTPDVATFAVLAAAVFGAAVWAGAELAAVVGHDRTVPVGAADTLRSTLRLPAHLGHPAEAWPATVRHSLPGPIVYWACTTVTMGVAVVIAAVIAHVAAAPAAGTGRRQRLGIDVKARFGRTRDLRPLLIREPVAGRFVLGRIGRRLVATEDGRSTVRGLGPRGDRSAVAVIGPTRCGKTANTISGILDWSGPAILSSVKTDLLGATIAHRRRVGDVRVFDPTGATDQPSASWSPLRAANTVSGAQKAARALADAAPQGGAENLNFFLALARQLLWPMLYAAAVGERSMADLVRWILTQERPLDRTRRGEVFSILDDEMTSRSAARRESAVHALHAISAIWELDERTRGSTYATCQTMVEPWQDPEVAATAAQCDIDLAWLLGGTGSNTLYICAPSHEQQRLATVFGGLLGDLVQQAYEQANATNTALPPTLVVLDEAGNTPTRWLPSVASTCSGIGLQLVTVWQSKAQIDAAYGRLADSVLTNHATKIIFAGVSDPATLDYAAHLLGDEEVASRSVSTDHAGARPRIDEATVRLPLLPVEALRRMRPGHALLLHGTLRPAHLIARPYWRLTRVALTSALRSTS